MKKANISCAVLTASAILTLGSAFTAAAAEWTMEDGEWAYRDNSGAYVTDTWKADGNNSFYLGSDGYMVRNSLIEVNGNYYYVNSAGAMVKNEWRQLENAEWQSESPEDVNWYYFDEKGRALCSENGEPDVETVNGKKYIFDEYGRMLTGWITASAEFTTDEDAWQEALYYSDAEEGDGSILTNAWLNISVHDEENEDDSEPAYWFYFSAGGKKVVDEQKTINGKKYLFNAYGAAQSGWVQNEENGTWQYYGSEDSCSLKTGWFEAVPDAELDEESHSDDTAHWFYATSSNAGVVTSQIKTVNSKSYGFNRYGEMLSGLYKLKVEDKVITEYAKIESEDDLPEDDQWSVYFFHDTSGEMRTGAQTVELDGETYTYGFETGGTDKGKGINGIDGNYIYDNGKRLKAESGTKYQIVVYDGKEYLVNTSGVLAKKKTNVTDSDGIYYCTNESGEVTYEGSEKYED